MLSFLQGRQKGKEKNLWLCLRRNSQHPPSKTREPPQLWPKQLPIELLILLKVFKKKSKTVGQRLKSWMPFNERNKNRRKRRDWKNKKKTNSLSEDNKKSKRDSNKCRRRNRKISPNKKTTRIWIEINRRKKERNKRRKRKSIISNRRRN